MEEKLPTLKKLRDTAAHEMLQQERDLSRLRAELEASSARVTKRSSSNSHSHHQVAEARREAQLQRERAEKAVSR